MAELATPTADVILCRPGDPLLGLAWELFDPTGGFEQTDGQPVMLVISEQTSDEKCRRLAVRFGVDFNRLIAFRDLREAGHG